MTTPLANIGGLVSGLDTNSIISQLMQVEARGQQALLAKKQTANDKISAYQTINNKVSQFQASAANLTTTFKWSLNKATSSNSDIATATASASATSGTLVFTVDRMAQAQALGSQNTVSSLTGPGLVAANGATISISVGGAAAVDVNAGDGSLQSVVNAINAKSDMGVSAAAVNIDGTNYRLQLTSKTTGATNTMSVSGLDAGFWGTPTTLTAAQDARIYIGATNPISVTSTTNTFTDVLPGVTLTAKKASAEAVTVTVGRDADTLASRVEAMVKAANDALSEIKTRTAYNPTTKQAATLTGDATARNLQSQILSVFNTTVSSSTYGSAFAAGISLDKTGSVSFDKSKFVTAYNADPSGIEKLFSQAGTFKVGGVDDTRVSLVAGTDSTKTGTYTVAVTTAASQAARQGTDLSGSGSTITGAETIWIKVGTTEVSYAALAGASLSSIATGLNSAMAGEDMGLTATVEGGKLTLRTASYGSAAAFEVKSNNVGAGQTGVTTIADAYESVAGVDVAGTINGVAATGAGQYLTAPSTDTTLAGLSLLVTSSGPVTGDLTYSAGIAQQLSTVGYNATNTTTGSLTSVIKGRQDYVTTLDKQISDWDQRLASRERTLRAQFTAMETALSRLRDQGNWLAGQLAGLSSGSA